MNFKKEGFVNSQARNLAFLQPGNSLISEQYRIIRTNIMFSNVDSDIQSVLFTSEMPGAGKSTTAANVAAAFAQAGKRTVLVDADLRRPTSHYTFGLSNQSGLTTGIVNQLPLEEIIKHTSVENLDLVTSGPVPPNPSELLSSVKMVQLLKELKSHYDMIIVDSPPVLAVTDAQILSKHTDGTVIVTDVKNNNVHRLKEAKQLLEKTDAKILGVVLNNVNMKKESKNNYHYYGSDDR